VEESVNFIPLLLVLLFAFIVPLVLGRFRWLPVVVGEILAGVIIGHSGFNLVHQSSALDFMNNVGLAFLIFLAGMEIDFDRILPSRNGSYSQNGEQGPHILTFALAVYVLTLALSLPAGFLLNHLGLDSNPFLLSFILSATSLGVLLPILKEREMTHTLAGQAIFFTAILADFVTVLLLTTFVIIHNNGLNLQILTVGMLFLAFFLVYRILGRFFRIPGVRGLIEDLSHVTVQIKVRGAIAILMAFVVLASVLGMELILGAFLAGMIISLLKTPEDSDLVHKLEAFGFGFFIPVFFILVGVNLDLRALLKTPQSLLPLPILLVMAVFVKFTPSILFRKMLSWRETLAAAALLNTHLSLEIAVAVIGLQLGLISEASNVTIILFAIITVLVMPLLFNRWMPSRPAHEKRYMLLYSAEDLGMQVANVLRQHGENILFLEPEARLVEMARRAGFEAERVDSVIEYLAKGQNDAIQGLIVLSGEDTRNLLVCRAAASQGIDNILTMVNDPVLLPEYRSLGVKTFAPAIYRPALLALMARSPAVFELLTSSTDSQDVREVHLRNPRLAGQSLKTLGLPGNLLVLAVNRDGDLIIPHGSTRLESGDRLTLLGNPEGLSETAAWLEERKPA
jgi:Kef-type K+ transport system membrane component KefB/Trk K+ transport system NAD-binding subunit